MSIAIDAGIPVPPVKRGLSLPFEEMDSGDSFALDIPNDAKAGVYAAKIRARANIYAKRHGGKFTVRLVEENREVRVRCWRTA